MASPSSRPVGLTICVGIVALVAGLAGGFVGGHLKGKAENATAVRDAKAAAEAAFNQAAVAEKSKADLAAKLVDANERLTETRKLLDERTGELVAVKREATKSTAGAAAISETISKLTRGEKIPKTYDDELIKLKYYLVAFLEDEPKRTSVYLKSNSARNIEVLENVASIRKDQRILDNKQIVDALTEANLQNVTFTYSLKRGVEDQGTMAMFKEIWNEGLTTKDLAGYVSVFMMQTPGDRDAVRRCIVERKSPDDNRVLIIVRMIAGAEFTKNLK